MRPFLALALIFLHGSLCALPSAPVLVSGAADIQTGTNTQFIQTLSDRTIIEWGDFSIGQQQLVDIVQPNATSAILNRVTSAIPSEIMGRLLSNGQVFLLNPNGIFISQEGVIDVGAMIASTLNVSDAAFIAGGDMTFSGSSTAAVENSGIIRGDEGVFLLGRHVINKGDILAIASRVDLGAGTTILLNANNAGIIIQADIGLQEGIGLENTGTISASQVGLRADGNLYSLAIRHTGSVIAESANQINGEAVFIAAGGEVRIENAGSVLSLDSNGVGGSIQISGETVTLNDQTTLNSAGEFGGGNVFVGGSLDIIPPLLEAGTVSVGSNVEIEADAHVRGDAGNVRIFSSGVTDFQGRITATGGLAGGNGGFVELSGITNLSFTGTVSTLAPLGAIGTLLLDPTDITISNGATAGGMFDGGSPTNTFSGTAAAATLNIGDLNAALASNNVIVTTTSAEAGVGNITFGAATALSLAGNNLTFLADNNIVISSTFGATSVGSTSNVLFSAGNDISLTSAVTGTSLNALTFSAGGNMILNNDISAIGATVSVMATGDITSGGGGVNTLFADQATLAAGGTITITNELDSTGAGAGSVASWTAGNEIIINNDILFAGWETVNLTTSTGNFVIDQFIDVNGVDTLTIQAGQDLVNQGGTNILTDFAINQTDLNLNATRDVILNSQLDINNFRSASINAGRDVLINQDLEPDGTLTVNIQATRDITTTSPGDIILLDVDTFTMTTLTGDVNIGDGVNISSANTTVNSGGDINVLDLFFSTGSATISMTASQDINVGPSAVISRIGSQMGDVTLNAGRDLTVTGGTGANDLSQIGVNAAIVDSDITITTGRNLSVIGGTNSNAVAIIGHGFSVAGSFTGDIIIPSVGGDLTIIGDTGLVGSVKYAQIGHVRSTSAAPSTVVGDIRGANVGEPARIAGALTITGGNDTTTYALLGHGGRDSNALQTYTGDIRVQAGSVSLNGGNSADAHAAIGYLAVAQAGAGTNPIVVNSPATVQVISDGTLEMTGNTNGIVSIGARAIVDATHPAILDLDLVDVQTGGSLIMTSGTGVETETTIGAFTNGFGANTASTTLSVDVGANLVQTAGTGSVAQIINGVATTDPKNTTVIVNGEITFAVNGVFDAFIQGTTGDTNVVAQGAITMPNALTTINNQGGTNGILSVTGGSMQLLDGASIFNLGTGTTNFVTTSGNVNLISSSTISSIGNLTGNVARDLILLEDSNINSSAGSSTIFITRDLNVTGTSSGPSSLTSFGEGIYRAGRDISLMGSSALNEGFIQNTTGELTVIAGVDLSVMDFGRIENLSTESTTLVVDNLFPNPPGIGPGSFELSSLGSVGRAGGGLLRIFTAVREQNLIEGTMNVNGQTFVPGPLFVNSATERWGTYFFSPFGGDPFTIFYKNNAPVPVPTVEQILAADPNAFIPFAELFYILEGYPIDPVWAWMVPLCVDDECLCETICDYNVETLRYGYQITNCRKLPPYVRYHSPNSFPHP